MAEQGKGATHITVACKLPHGLRLRLYKMEPFAEPVLGGGVRETKKAVQVGNEVVLNGYRQLPFGQVPRAMIASGFALTSNVPKDFFEEWLKQNKDSAVVKQGLIFAHVERESVEDQAKDHRKVRNGLEPLDPKNLPKLSPTFAVETADTKEAA